ncbi:hypothetical protein P9112_002203 [Eukaryota sp. TZLM1-RC]
MVQKLLLGYRYIVIYQLLSSLVLPSVINIHPYTSGIVCSLSTNQLTPISTDYVDNPLPMVSDVISLNLPCTTNNSLISSFSVFYRGSPYILNLKVAQISYQISFPTCRLFRFCFLVCDNLSAFQIFKI